MKETLKSAAVIVTILLAGFGVSGLLVALRAEPPREAATKEAPLVEAQQIEAQQGALRVVGTGIVRPTREINLAAEVGGQLISVDPALASGGTFRAGDVLAQVDPADYRNAVDMAEAEVTQRRFELLQAEEEVQVAQREWERLQARGTATTPDSTSLGRLVFREPQRALAEAALRAAEARLDDATLRLSRTNIVAPFDGRVRAKQVDLGQFVNPGQTVASIYGTDDVEIVVQLSSRQVDLIDPSWTLKDRVPATVQATIGERRVTWDGYVDRLEGAVDPTTRQVNLVVRVPRPYAPQEGEPPLFVGTFTTVQIQAQTLDRFFDVPRSSVHDRDADGSTVYVLEDGTLKIQPVRVIQQVEDRMLVDAEALPEAFDLILTDLPVVTDSMVVRNTLGSN